MVWQNKRRLALLWRRLHNLRHQRSLMRVGRPGRWTFCNNKQFNVTNGYALMHSQNRINDYMLSGRRSDCSDCLLDRQPLPLLGLFTQWPLSRVHRGE